MNDLDLMQQYPNPHAFGCPWHHVAEVFGAPNVKWCEQTLCQWISEPANTWSNVGYVLVAIYLWYKWKNHAFAPLRLAPIYIFTMGFFSFLYHLSNFYPSQIMDFFGMFVCLYNILMINLHRLNTMSKPKFTFYYWTLVIVSLFIMHLAYINFIPIQATILVIVLVIISTEIKCHIRGLGAKRYGYFFISLGLLVLAASCSAIDLKRIWCNPFNHWVQGHALWHLFSAIMIGVAYSYYGQLWDDKKIKNF